MTEMMERFAAVREELQMQRALYRDNRQDRRNTWHGLDVEDLAEQVAGYLFDRIAYRGDQWRNLATGQPVPSAVVISTVRDLLPESIEGERRELLAQVVTASATLRGMLSRRA